MNQQLRSAVALVEETATMPGLRQWYGMWLKNGKCCMGARLAHALQEDNTGYTNGMRKFAARAGCTVPQLVVMMRQAGAPRPISPTPSVLRCAP